jgi:hypothetical protein
MFSFLKKKNQEKTGEEEVIEKEEVVVEEEEVIEETSRGEELESGEEEYEYYEIDENGNVDTYKTNSNVSAEEYQYKLKKELGLKSYPCFFCDTTIQMCGDQGFSLEKNS